MSKGKSKPKKMKCDFCGAPFEARRKNAKHCAACNAAIRRADVEERRRRAAANRPRCLYCGHVYGVNSSGYCVVCLRTGLDGLHKETGRTNGWDRPATAKVKVEVEGGWRGRPVAGGGPVEAQ